jgi:tRNA(adenine34) deaminase
MNINYFMQKALDQANLGLIANEVPIGGVLVDNNSYAIISKSHNLVNFNKNATSHAEIIIINDACKIRNSKYLTETSLFITLEPCAMCAAAISEVHINNIYFGAYDEKKGSIDSIMKIYNQNHHYTPEIYGGIFENECSQILKNFFKNKRKK